MAYSADPTLYLYTSLTAGSSHIITATSRLETILKANKIPFRAIDCATDEKARMLWGRRSRGRKLPGLVRYGSVVGDLEQIEEWNEYGELKDQINSTQDLGLAASTAAPANTINPTGTLHPEPLVTSAAPTSDPSSRASSQGRHISISEPTAKEKEHHHPTSDPKSAKSPSDESPQNLIMRQLGAEAAAKAKDRKTSGPGSMKAAPVPTTSPTAQTAQTPTPASAISQDAEPPATHPETTAAKTPAQLAAEGKTRTSTEKIGSNISSPTSSPAPESESGNASGTEEKSKEEQILELRRTSTQTKQPSRLSESTPAEKSGEVLPSVDESKADAEPSEHAPEDDGEEATAEHVSASTTVAGATLVTGAVASTETATDTDRIPSAASARSGSVSSGSASIPTGGPPPPERRRSHRGSSLEEADKEAIRRAEEAIRIQEEDEEEDEDEDEDEDDEDAIVESSIEKAEVDEAEARKGEKKVEEREVESVDAEKEIDQKEAQTGTGKEKEGVTTTKPQETQAADGEAAGKSVGD